ncbi:MAG: leucine-rich repeat domain-containing protein [Ruminococcus sp.]|nr:leucine-rich repeat domain-containing protein [Ruminococcus sp.]
MKRLTAIILITTLLFSVIVFSACNCSSSDSTVSIQSTTAPPLRDEYGVGYKLNDDGTLAVSAYDGKDKDVSIPIDYEGRVVKNIAKSAFKGLDIESVTMPDGMKEIDGYAFALCQKLNIVNISEGVKKIGDNAFFATFALTEIELPETLETIGINAFNASSIEKIIIPKKVKKIDSLAFADCKSLTEIKVLSKNTKVADTAFKTGAKTKVIAPKGSSAIKAAKKCKLSYVEK